MQCLERIELSYFDFVFRVLAVRLGVVQYLRELWRSGVLFQHHAHVYNIPRPIHGNTQPTQEQEHQQKGS